MSSHAEQASSDIRQAVLRSLYEAYFPGEDACPVRPLLERYGWSEMLFWRALEEMEGEGLIRCFSSGPQYIIQPRGVLHAEQNGTAPVDLAALNNEVRTAIMCQYADAYEATGRHEGPHVSEVLARVLEATGAHQGVALANLQFLYESRQLEHPGALGFFVISATGLRATQDWRERGRLLQEFETLPTSENPQQRGRDFQNLFGRLAARSGWTVDESVLGPGEEIDLVLQRDEGFYLVECRWKSSPVSTKEIRDFVGKLRKRSGAIGLFISMSGYSSDAVEEVRGLTGDAPIILFGPRDIEDLFKNVAGLDNLLTSKRRALVLKREIVFK